MRPSEYVALKVLPLPMHRIGVRELRQNASRYLTLVKGGETVEVTERGKLVALLTPAHPSRPARDRLVAAGKVVPAQAPTGRFPLPGAVAHDLSNQELLTAERADRL